MQDEGRSAAAAAAADPGAADYLAASLYVITFNLGLIGNCWVIRSVLRSRRPNQHVITASPADRLRAYIGMLALIDLSLCAALLIRVFYTAVPTALVDPRGCRSVFLLEWTLKMAALFCLACICLERYITIRKPFDTLTRKRCLALIPIVALSLFALLVLAIIVQATGVSSRRSGHACQWISTASTEAARYAAAVGQVAPLLVVAVGYFQIVRHVRRKFWQRKARAASCSLIVKPAASRLSSSQSSSAQAAAASAAATAAASSSSAPVSEPRYMREMTNSIGRLAGFHVACWAPHCLLLFAQTEPVAQPRLVDGGSDGASLTSLSPFLFVANWLPFLGAALDWVFYAALNRELRALIRLTTERRKRSTFSSHAHAVVTSPSGTQHHQHHQARLPIRTPNHQPPNTNNSSSPSQQQQRTFRYMLSQAFTHNNATPVSSQQQQQQQHSNHQSVAIVIQQQQQRQQSVSVSSSGERKSHLEDEEEYDQNVEEAPITSHSLLIPTNSSATTTDGTIQL